MQFIPAFELGVWNAWIFMVYVILINVLPYLIFKMRPSSKEIVKKVTNPDIPLTKTEKKLGIIMSVVFIIPIIYSIFLPIELYTIWFYIGLFLYLLGVVIETISMYDFFTTPVDTLVIKGIYRISRNPMYLGMFLIFLGIGIACISWLFLLLTILFIILTYFLVRTEERFCLKTYGKSYREYLNKIPRWIGFLNNNNH